MTDASPLAAGKDNPAATTHVDDDLYCVGCGYNLRTLRLDAVCPECASPVRQSRFSDVHRIWLRRVHRGLSWLLVAYAGVLLLHGVWIASVCLGTAGAWSTSISWVWATIHLVLTGCYLGGIIFATGRPPYRMDVDPSGLMRPIVRSCAVIVFLLGRHSLLMVFSVLFRSMQASFVLFGFHQLVSFVGDCVLALYLLAIVRLWRESCRPLAWVWITILTLNFAANALSLGIGYTIMTRVGFGGFGTPNFQLFQWTSIMYAASLFTRLAVYLVGLIFFAKCRSIVATRLGRRDAPPAS